MKASENGAKGAIIPAQSRAARALLDWSRDQLSDASGVPKRTLVRFEAGEVQPQRRTAAAIQAALEAAGVEFLPQGKSGAGVRLAKPEASN